jgi:Sulfocyanin (SoxE) domain
MPDTPPTVSDTTQQTRSDSSPQKPPPPDAAAKRDTSERKRPRPNIDPGRVPSKPMVVPGAAQKSGDTSNRAASGQGSQWLKYDAATNTVTFDLIAGPFDFNGYTNGGATLVVPAKANVVMPFVNKDGTPHSAQIISGEGPIPNAAVDAAIPRAYTNKVLEGLPQEATDTMRFPVPESGTYRIFCGVPGHGLSGMWIWMRVDPAAKAPSFGPTKA